jgi:hypothetical protein
MNTKPTYKWAMTKNNSYYKIINVLGVWMIVCIDIHSPKWSFLDKVIFNTSKQ